MGPDFPLMLDCYMAMNVPYTIKLAKALAPLGLKWIEEFLPPDDYDGYKEVRQALKGTGVLTTTGEHEYTRYGFRKLIQDRAVDVLQPDITWLGGLTEARRVVAMAAAYASSTERMTAPRPPMCRNTLTRKRDTPGIV